MFSSVEGAGSSADEEVGCEAEEKARFVRSRRVERLTGSAASAQAPGCGATFASTSDPGSSSPVLMCDKE